MQKSDSNCSNLGQPVYQKNSIVLVNGYYAKKLEYLMS